MESVKAARSFVKYLLIVVMAVGFSMAGWYAAMHRLSLASILFATGLFSGYFLFRVLNQASEAVGFFFEALRNDDTAIRFPAGKGNDAVRRLYSSMNLLNSHFQEIKWQYEQNEQYYRTLIHNSATGLLVLDELNAIEMINKKACQYAGISHESINNDLLRIKNPPFYQAACQLEPGTDITYKNRVGNRFELLFFHATLIRKKDRNVKLVSIQDIRDELEMRQVTSYRKLISVLTHEIMNLMTPLTAVAKALHRNYEVAGRPKRLDEMDEETLANTNQSLLVIEEQTSSITHFIDAYRKLSRIPQPEINAFGLEEWMEQLRIVFHEKMTAAGIGFEISADRRITHIMADKKLINQVMINLLNNAYEAVMEISGRRQVMVRIMQTHDNRITVEVSNNGPSIPPDIQDKIFVPFFTTKKSGSGIGLSISQEIMKMHKGSLMIFSGNGDFTSFIMEL